MAMDRVAGTTPIARARLPPAGVGARALAPGQVLMIRVVGQSPHLELTLLEGDDMPQREASDEIAVVAAQAQDETAAVQPDQAAIRRLMGAGPDATALAAAWRAMVLERMRRAAIVSEGRPAPAAQESSAVFRTTVWPGVAMAFWLLWEDELALAAGRVRPGQPGARLRISLFQPDLGQVTIDVELRSDGAGLVLMAARPPMVPALRGRVGLIAARMAHASLRLMRCHVEQGIAYEPKGEEALLPAVPQEVLAAALPEGLFRAAAETVAALSLPFR